MDSPAARWYDPGMDNQTAGTELREVRALREVPRPFTCGKESCRQRDGSPRPMRKFVSPPGPRVKRLEGGATRQITVVTTHWTCDKCGDSQKTEQEI